jgi:hypothetical protein
MESINFSKMAASSVAFKTTGTSGKKSDYPGKKFPFKGK